MDYLAEAAGDILDEVRRGTSVDYWHPAAPEVHSTCHGTSQACFIPSALELPQVLDTEIPALEADIGAAAARTGAQVHALPRRLSPWTVPRHVPTTLPLHSAPRFCPPLQEAQLLASAETELGEIEVQAAALDEALAGGEPAEDVANATGGLLGQIAALRSALRGM